MILPLPRTRTVEPLQIAVDHEDQVVELLAHGHRDRAHRLGLVRLAVAEEAPDFRSCAGKIPRARDSA
jgi:hypothetical protein